MQYGSSVTREFVAKHSDYNVLVVASDLTMETLRELRPIMAQWQKSGQRAPLLFTRKRLAESTDVFPLELFDLRDRYRVIHGEDVVSELDLTADHLRWQLEAELKAKLITVREAYFAVGDKPKQLLDFMLQTVGSFQVLMRGMLRLLDAAVPAEKAAVSALVAERFGLDLAIFDELHALKQGGASAPPADSLFARYLTAVEALVDTVNEHLSTDSSR